MDQTTLDAQYLKALALCTEHEQMVVREYLIDFHRTNAYTRATPGVAPSTAPSACTRMMLRPRVDAAVKAGAAALGHKLHLTAERVLEELARLAFANLADYITVQEDGSAIVDLSELDRDQAAAISEIQVDEYVEGKGEDARDVKRVKIKLVDKGVNLERLGRHLKLFTDKVEVSGLEQLADRIRQAREHTDLLG